MPGPAIVAVGPAAVAATVHAAKHVAAHAYFYAPEIGAFSSATLAAVLARTAWNTVPEWIKEDVSFQNLVGQTNEQHKGEESREELTHMSSVIEKLQALAKIGSSKLDSPVPQLHAALLAYVQLSAQLKKQQQQQYLTSQQTRNEEKGKEVEQQVEQQGVKSGDGRRSLRNGMDKSLSRDYLYETSGESWSPKDIQNNDELKDALIYATWSYYEDSNKLQDNLEEFDFFLLDHSLASRPGYVAYYVAVSPERKQVIVGIKGTSGLEDLLTDCCGRAVPFVDHTSDDYDDKARIEVRAAQPNEVRTNEDTGDIEIISGHERISVEDHDDDGDHFVRCHEGILLSSQRLADKIQDTVEQLVLGDGKYRLTLCGHSLGAGAASLVALILRSRFPDLTRIENKELMHVYAFAPPPVLDHDAALAASSYCTTIVNNADIIPRSSLANLLVFLEFLRSIHTKLKEKGINPTGPLTSAAFIKKMLKGTNGDLLMTAEEVRDAMNAAHDKIELRNPDHLYPPGKVLLAYKPWEIKICEEDGERGSTEEKHGDEIDDYVMIKNPCYPFEIVRTNGTATVLRVFEFDGSNMFTNHVTSSYYEILGLDYSF